MINKLKVFVVLVLLLFFSCKKLTNNKITNNNNNVVNLKKESQVPSKIKKFITKNKDKWSKVSLDDFNKELVVFLKQKNNSNPQYIKGDFSNNGKEDFAIILRNKKYKVDTYGNYKFPFLLVFNDYKNSIKPIIVYKTGAYKNNPVSTVIYSESEYGILSYLEKGAICNMNVININYFEKSGFFVYWDKEKNNYQFLNYLDYPKTTLCNIITNKKPEYLIDRIKTNKWNGKYTSWIDAPKGTDTRNGIQYELKINTDKIIFSEESYSTEYKYLCNAKQEKDTLYLSYYKTISGTEPENTPIYKMYENNNNTYIISSQIYDTNGNNNVPIPFNKE